MSAEARENDYVENGILSDEGLGFSEKSIRLGFIRKVYGILSLQLLVTLGFIAIFIFVEEVKQFSILHQELYIVAIVVTIVLILVLACCDGVRRRTPWNIIILAIFTICMSWMIGSISSHFEGTDVMIAVGITAAITIGLTIFAFQTKFDFTMWGGMLMVFLIGLIFFGILCAIIRSDILNMMYATLGAVLFGFYLVFDTQMMIGGKHRYALSPEEYIFAALNLYLDIINLFLNILSVIGLSKK